MVIVNGNRNRNRKARKKYPDEVFYFNKIGYRAVYVHR